MEEPGTEWIFLCPLHEIEYSLYLGTDGRHFNFEFNLPLPLDVEKYREIYQPSDDSRSMPGKAQIYHRCQVIFHIIRKSAYTTVHSF